MTDLSTVPDNSTRAPALVGHAGVESCDRVDGLVAITKPDIDLVIWRRTLAPAFTEWLDRLSPSDLPDLRLLAEPSQVCLALETKLAACRMPPGEMRDLLINDIGCLASTFAEIAKTDLVDVRLEGVSHDACWRFHRDCVEARLLTTYLGPATEWVSNAYAEQALSEQTEYRGALERLDAHDVAFFKGSCAGPGSGIVHRSPPIANTGQTRLLLCLNKRSIISPQPWQTV